MGREREEERVNVSERQSSHQAVSRPIKPTPSTDSSRNTITLPIQTVGKRDREIGRERETER